MKAMCNQTDFWRICWGILVGTEFQSAVSTILDNNADKKPRNYQLAVLQERLATKTAEAISLALSGACLETI